MKMFSNLSGRDRNLLMVLLVAVVFYLCYSMIIAPSLESATILKEEAASIKSELDRAKDLIGREEELGKQAAGLREALADKYSVFFADLNQSRLLYKLDTLMLNAGITVSSYIPSPETAAPVPLEQGSFLPVNYPLLDLAKEIQPSLHQQEGLSAEETNGMDEGASDMIPGADITFVFENSTYESVYAFINAVEMMNKTVRLKNIDITKDETGISGQLIFGFYSLPTLEEKKKDELKFDPVLPKGKANPFQ